MTSEVSPSFADISVRAFYLPWTRMNQTPKFMALSLLGLFFAFYRGEEKGGVGTDLCDLLVLMKCLTTEFLQRYCTCCDNSPDSKLFK